MSIIGIRDSNDEVVAATLRALADIVPALGATTVKKDLFFILDPALYHNRSEMTSNTKFTESISFQVVGKNRMKVFSDGSPAPVSNLTEIFFHF